jgi:hypothetical protein
MNNHVIPLDLRLDTLEAERMAIGQCAKYIRRRIEGLQAGEAWISCGEHLARLKQNLVKETPRGDNEHIGWNKAFELGEFPFGRIYADRLIKVYEFFKDTTVPLKNLPATVYALLAIASVKFSKEQLEQAMADGMISPGTTEKEIIALARKFKLVKTKAKKKIDALSLAPKRERIAAVWELMARLKLTIKDLTDA